ncbi:MAG TPA: hypothetical protein VEA36_01735 [Candidatus Paceibacterota bacterium]|nr:hypothetical protein [Candidatus Paceibacterota bacterium]
MIRTIILILAIVLVLSFFGISIQSVVQSPAGQENFGFLWSLIKEGWEVVKDGWDAFKEFLGNLFRPIQFPR